jgi:hypothetical protein
MAVLESIGGGGYYLWRYLPSVPAAVIFVLLFLGLTGLILWRMFKTRTWFCIPFAIGGICKYSLAEICICGVNMHVQSKLLDIAQEPQHTTKQAK